MLRYFVSNFLRDQSTFTVKVDHKWNRSFPSMLFEINVFGGEADHRSSILLTINLMFFEIIFSRFSSPPLLNWKTICADTSIFYSSMRLGNWLRYAFVRYRLGLYSLFSQKYLCFSKEWMDSRSVLPVKLVKHFQQVRLVERCFFRAWDIKTSGFVTATKCANFEAEL